MRLKINFLNQHRRKLTSLEKKDKQYYKYSTWFFIFFVCVSIASVGVNLFFSFSLDRVKESKTLIEASVLGQSDIEKSALVLAAKVGSLSDLVTQRGDKQQAIQYFSGLFPDDKVLIKGIDYQSKEGVLQLRIESESIFIYEEVVALLESETTKNQFDSIAKSDLRRSENGTYSVMLTVVLKKNVLRGDS
jgi:hypothetical protein